MKNNRTRKLLSAAGALAFLLVLAIGAAALRMGVLGGGNLSRARQIAARLQVEAMANPNPAPSAALSAEVAAPPAPATTTAHAAAATVAGNGKITSRSPATAPPGTAPRGTVAAGTVPPATVARTSGPTMAPRPAAASTLAPRRQPTSAEIAQAIIAVNSVIPFFTPSPDQIASAGDKVCTALDQGQTYAQVQATALDMVGAGSFSWAIPSSVPAVAIQTVVALYCPTNATKLH